MTNKTRYLLFAAMLACTLRTMPARGDVTPMDAVLKEDGITRITCVYDGEPVTPAPGVTFKPVKGEYHYDLYLPAGYHTDANDFFWCLFVASPGGKAGLGVMADRMKRDRFVAVMLVESKNGAWEPGIANFCAAHDDVMKRVRVADGFKYMTGMSGGARSTSMYTALRPGFVGMFLQSAGFWQTPEGPYAMTSVLDNPRLAVYATFGIKDMNLDEAGLLAQYLPSKTMYHSLIFHGGHQWAPKPQVEEAFDWLEQWTYFALPAETTATARTMYLNYFNRLSGHCREDGTDFEKYEWIEKAVKFAASHEFKMNPSLIAALGDYQKQAAKLAGEDGIKRELAARSAWLKVAGAEESGRRQAGRNVEKLKMLLPQIARDYQDAADKHPGTVYSIKAHAAVERLKVESSE